MSNLLGGQIHFTMNKLSLVQLASAEVPTVTVHYLKPGQTGFTLPWVSPDLYFPGIGLPLLANPYEMVSNM